MGNERPESVRRGRSIFEKLSLITFDGASGTEQAEKPDGQTDGQTDLRSKELLKI